MRQVRLDQADRFEERDRVAVVFLDARRDREDVRVEDDLLGGEADLVYQQAVRAFADGELALGGLGLAVLVECHHDDGRAVPADGARLLQEGALALLQADRVDDPLALHALQSGLDHRPARRVHHDRDTGDVRLRGDEVEEAAHRHLRVQHSLVHVHINDLGAGLHLLAGDIQRGIVVAVEDEASEAGGAGDVRALTDVDERGAAARGVIRGDRPGIVWWGGRHARTQPPSPRARRGSGRGDAPVLNAAGARGRHRRWRGCALALSRSNSRRY